MSFKVASSIALAIISISAVACDGAGKSTESSTTGARPATMGDFAPTTTEPPARAVQASGSPVHIEVFAPEAGHRAGIGGVGFFVDMEIEFPGATLKQTGFNGFQLTGPGVHANANPFPKPAGAGHDESMPGLIVVCSTSTVGAGPGQNLAGLFNLSGLTNRSDEEMELWDTWILAGPACGKNVQTIMLVAFAADLNHDGIYNDAPDVVPDSNHDGKITEVDLQAVGLASDITRIPFFINP